MMSGRLAEAQSFLDKSLAAYDPAKHDGLAFRFGQEIGVAIHIYHSLNALLMGDTSRAALHAREAENRALASGHIITICYMHGHFIICAMLANDRPALVHHLNALKPIVEEHNLYISAARIDGGPMFKRMRPRARGMAHIIKKRSSHITVEIEAI